MLIHFAEPVHLSKVYRYVCMHDMSSKKCANVAYNTITQSLYISHHCIKALHLQCMHMYTACKLKDNNSLNVIRYVHS